MDELRELLRPVWGAEKWILEGWNKINTEDKALIKTRIHDLFKNGLPFELKHDKLLYIYTFSLLAQLEVLAIQVPLKFEGKMSSAIHKELMHTQLLDEIFHGLVFTKIVYLLCEPNATPPEYSQDIEVLCNFIREEDCPKIGVVLLNLIGEGWIEEIFYSLKQQNVAPKVFETILADEHRHVCEADLYRDIGLPDMDVLRPKLEFLEDQLLTNIFFQYKYIFSVCSLLGVQGTIDFLQALNDKHVKQLGKINQSPGERWQYFMQMGQDILPRIQNYTQYNYEVEMTPIRRVLMTQWDGPSDPTMVGEFNVNVSCLDIFGKKYPSETLTTLMMQTVSHVLSTQDSFRNFLNHQKLYQSKEAYVSIVVKLPDCGDHMGTILFENCHNMAISTLAARIRQGLRMMVYCYKKRAQLDKTHLHLKEFVDSGLQDLAYAPYPYPIPGSPVVSLSNIGACGYTRAKSPLRKHEGLKVTLLEVERKLVWNKKNKTFEAEDLLPVSISADHRIFDGNIPIPKLIQQTFKEMFEKMQPCAEKPVNTQEQDAELMKMMDQFLAENLELGYRSLCVLQTIWADFMSVAEFIQENMRKEDIAMMLDKAMEMHEPK